ncbi:hypothetical protein BCON_0274g00010 [Botryotinia convoluta]|uniref:Uncharacterized protein n=1 Tax=Botryotinia convoluta TaxID=54673 RepID=A0A4Z1HJU6_9HELO|nr:hypothetical protein BCON_0274g00010 [Botryotinia convoluta]
MHQRPGRLMDIDNFETFDTKKTGVTRAGPISDDRFSQSMSGWLKTDRVLDAQAADVVKELRSHGVYIDPKLPPASCPKTTTVYHMEKLTPELAEALYQVGFLNIGACDHEGCLPLLAQINFETPEVFDMSRWLITKGVDLTETLNEENMITTLHDALDYRGL